MYDLQTIEMTDLTRCPIQLRPVCKETLQYVQLRDAIRDHGILVPLLVRLQDGRYEVVDGHNRYEIARDLRLPGVPCIVREMTDRQVRQFQILIHISSIDTPSVEEIRRLWQIIEVEKTFTLNELAMYLRKHPDWLRKRLNLIKLSPKAQFYLTNSDFGVIIGVELAKLPHSKQDELLKYVGQIPARELKDMVVQEARHYREGVKDKRLSEKQDSDYRYRPFREVVHELEHPTVAATVLSREEAATVMDGWNAHAKWVLMNDSATVAEALVRREKEQARKAALLVRNTETP